MATVAEAIAATRGLLHGVAAAEAWVLSHPDLARALRGKTLVYFNGAFSPPTRAHGHIAAEALKRPGVDCVWIDPEPARPGKDAWLDETLAARVTMCELMAADACMNSGRIGVGTLRKDLGPELGQSVALFHALRALVGGPEAGGRIIWALGADVFEGMSYWKAKALACMQPGRTCDGLLLFTRGGWTEQCLGANLEAIDDLTCEVQVLPVPEDSVNLSSTSARCALVEASAAASPDPLALEALLPAVARYCLVRPSLCQIYGQQVEAKLKASTAVARPTCR